MTALAGPPITRARRRSAVAKAALIAEVARHVDDSGADALKIECGPSLYEPGRPRATDAVVVQTDGPGFNALVGPLELRVYDRADGNVYGYGEVGLLDVPVMVFAPLVQTLAAGLAVPS